MNENSFDVQVIYLLKAAVIAELTSENNLVNLDIKDLEGLIEKHSKRFNLPLSVDARQKTLNLIRSEIDITVGQAEMIVGDGVFREWYTRDLLKQEGFWERFHLYISSPDKSLPKNVIRQVDEDSDRIVRRLGNPVLEESFNCRGMVVGDVQAGKTLSYSALINKACDAGYKVVIVLAGVTEKLRIQTQQRLDSDFVGEVSSVGNAISPHANFVGVGKINNKLRIICRTDISEDFKNKRGFSLDAVKTPVLIVAKKNKSPLKAIISFLNNQKNQKKEKVKHPVLIIDDEADNASVNAGNEGADPKTINHLIRQINDHCARVSYVGYTATPFANIFISPDDSFDNSDIQELFPKDFVMSLTSPTNYCGGKFFFLDETKEIALCEIDTREANLHFPKNKPLIGLPDSLKKAINQFYLVAAIKDFRRANNLLPANKENKFDSCLINVAVKKTTQNNLKPLVSDYIEETYADIKNSSPKRLGATVEIIKEIFESEFLDSLELETSWNDVLSYLMKIEKPRVVVINSDSIDDLDWEDDSPRKVIAIGGFTLSRGITLNGLTISYLFRNSKMYDTILQMGRWFGYRDGYRDLVRLWCEPSFAKSFEKAVLATEDLRSDIAQMTRLKMTPRQFGMKIASYPGLLPTAKNKMQTASEVEITVSYAGSKPESHCFSVDEQIEDKNKKSVEEFTKQLVDVYPSVIRTTNENVNKHIAFENVSSDLVIDLLINFEFHPNNNGRISEGFFRQYLDELRHTELKLWDVIFFSRSKNLCGKAEEISKLLKFDVNLQQRSIFLRPWNEDNDKTCIHLTANRTVTAGAAIELITSQDKPSLLIQYLSAGEIFRKNDKKDSTAVPDHLLNVRGREFVALKIFFPMTNNFKVVTCRATVDYVKKFQEENADDSEVEEL